MNSRNSITTPRSRRRIGIHYDPEAFGNFSEGVARFIGTGRFLVYQTVLVSAWIFVNYLVFKFDGDQLQLLTLLLSLQAAYAAPLILLAQNRQEARDRESLKYDREFNARTQADTEFLAREVAGVRMSVSDIPTATDIHVRLDHLTVMIEKLLANNGVDPGRRSETDG